MEVIVFGDLEDRLVGYLSAVLAERGDSATVAVTVPNPRPERFVLVPRIGGVRRNLVVDSATIAVECWASTDAEAANLAALVRGLIGALPGQVLDGITIYRVDEFSGPANLPDARTAQARYTFTVSISYRGAAA
jgi:hypothetical protein